MVSKTLLRTNYDYIRENGYVYCTSPDELGYFVMYCSDRGLEVEVKRLDADGSYRVSLKVKENNSKIGRPSVGVTRRASLTLPPGQMVEFETIANENNVKLAHLLRVAVQFYLENCEEVDVSEI